MTQATLSQEPWARNQQMSLLDLLDRLLNTGVVVDGEILLTVADIDLVYLGLKCVLASVETLEKSSSGKPPRETYKRSDRTGGPEAGDLSCEVEERPSHVPLQEDKAPSSAEEKTQVMETKQDFRETPFFENPQAQTTQASQVSPQASRNKIKVDPEKVEKGLVKLVLTVVELLRKLMERQAIRRMEGGRLGRGKIEELGNAFLRLDEKMEELKKFFGLKDEDLNLELGPLGTLI